VCVCVCVTVPSVGIFSSSWQRFFSSGRNQAQFLIGWFVQVNKGNIDVYNLTSNFDQMTFYNDNGLVHADQLSGLRVNLNTSYGEVRRPLSRGSPLLLPPPRCRGGWRTNRNGHHVARGEGASHVHGSRLPKLT
jgi:hypothetical protein